VTWDGDPWPDVTFSPWGDGTQYPPPRTRDIFAHLIGDAHAEVRTFPATAHRVDAPIVKEAARPGADPFTPDEKRSYIDEEGEASNASKLALEGTHYLREDGKPAQVPDFMLFLPST
jgi:hypothetical protein